MYLDKILRCMVDGKFTMSTKRNFKTIIFVYLGHLCLRPSEHVPNLYV